MIARKHRLPLALNHMTVPGMAFSNLLMLASDLGCVGVELRNDLDQPLFDGRDAAEAKAEALSCGAKLLALAEVKNFNKWSEEVASSAESLIKVAAASGATAVCLIPVNDGTGCGNGERQANLRVAMRNLRPLLEDHQIIGLIEPLGFGTCSLRYKEEAVDAIEGLSAAGQFRVIHDTFHHFIAGEKSFFPGHTGIVHISGVIDPAPSADEMNDAHRVLVEPGDRLDNLGQLAVLLDQGYSGPASFEAFAPEIHALTDPRTALFQSIEFIESHLAREAA